MIVALAGSAQTLSSGGANMTPDFYPKPNCEPAGTAPVAPGNNPDALQVYNLKVRRHHRQNGDGDGDLGHKRIAGMGRMFGMLGMLMRIQSRIVAHLNRFRSIALPIAS